MNIAETCCGNNTWVVTVEDWSHLFPTSCIQKLFQFCDGDPLLWLWSAFVIVIVFVITFICIFNHFEPYKFIPFLILLLLDNLFIMQCDFFCLKCYFITNNPSHVITSHHLRSHHITWDWSVLWWWSFLWPLLFAIALISNLINLSLSHL